jgi:hypothetical protein
MLKNSRIYLVGIIVLFAALIALQHYSPKPIDWSENYNFNKKSPYGCWVLNDMLDTLFPKQSIMYNEESFYSSIDTTSIEPLNLIVITDKFDPDEYDTRALLLSVLNGNDMLVSASYFGSHFADKLKVSLSRPSIDTSAFKSGDDITYLEHSKLNKSGGFHFIRKMPMVSISKYDSLQSQKLGTNRQGETNFIGVKYGLGHVYIHTQPLVFTNYHLLYGNVEYASKVLSYLPVRTTICDHYYKPDRIINQSPMRYILSQASLRSAYYLMLLTLILYMLLESKRRQRIIPVVKAHENSSLQFLKTVGGLYFKQHNNAHLARKKVIFFKEFLREHYHLTQISPTTESIDAIAYKTGVPLKLVKQLMEMIYYYDSSEKVSDEGLMDLNRKMEIFYEQCL